MKSISAFLAMAVCSDRAINFSDLQCECLPSMGGAGVGLLSKTDEFNYTKVIAPDGKVLFASDFGRSTNDCKLLVDVANWRAEGSMLRQSTRKEFIQALSDAPDSKFGQNSGLTGT